MFGRKKESSPVMDDHLTFMSRAEADELRARVEAAFAAAGAPVEMFPDRAVTPDGHNFMLWNLATFCRSAEGGRAEWDALIQRHVHTMLNPPPSASQMTGAELLPLVHSRLFSSSVFPDPSEDSTSYRHEIAEGIVEILVADFPESLVSLTASDVEAHGADALWEHGRAHTLATPIESRGEHEAESGAKVTVVMGESFYLASRIVDMPGLLREAFGEREYPLGVIVGVPHRHQVVLHPLDDERSKFAIGLAANFTARMYSDSPGSISPLLYWWNGDGFQTVSQVGDDGSIAILNQGAFMDAVKALT